MNHRRKNKILCLKLNVVAVFIFVSLQLCVHSLYSQEQKEATIKLTFSQKDSPTICKAIVLSNGLPVNETEIHLYAKRFYSLLPIGKVVATDSNGEADISLPMDLPGDKDGNLVVIAKIEKNETYGNVETQETIKWAVLPKGESDNWSNRSLAASREKAPMFLVVASILLILGIWGSILYLIFQLVRIKKSGILSKETFSAVN